MKRNTDKHGERHRGSVWLRRLAVVMVAFGLFTLGVGVGEGKIRFNAGASVDNDLPAQLNYSSIDELYDALRENYNGKLTENQLLNGLKSGLANATNDPYTEYFTAAEAKAFNDQLNNSFSGIGAELGKDKSGNLIVVAPISGFPAEKAGIKAQDAILAVDSKSTSGLSLTEAVSKIRGKAGTTVKLTVLRNKSEQLDFSITRQNIQIPSVSYETLPGGIAYVRINSFAEDTSARMASIAAQIKSSSAKGVVLDLRNNPGGLLDASVAVSSQWLPEGTKILEEKRGNTVTRTFTASGSSPLRGMPTVVLINSGSASASEITAGALRDHNAATIIGTKSFGKGVVQQLVKLKDGGELKVTIASWYRPNGQNINKKGITPDKVVELAEDDTAGGSDAQKAAAIEYLQKRSR